MANDEREVYLNGDVGMEIIHTDDKIDFFIAVGDVAGLYMTPGQFADLFELMEAYINEVEEDE